MANFVSTTITFPRSASNHYHFSFLNSTSIDCRRFSVIPSSSRPCLRVQACPGDISPPMSLADTFKANARMVKLEGALSEDQMNILIGGINKGDLTEEMMTQIIKEVYTKSVTKAKSFTLMEALAKLVVTLTIDHNNKFSEMIDKCKTKAESVAQRANTLKENAFSLCKGSSLSTTFVEESLLYFVEELKIDVGRLERFCLLVNSLKSSKFEDHRTFIRRDELQLEFSDPMLLLFDHMYNQVEIINDWQIKKLFISSPSVDIRNIVNNSDLKKIREKFMEASSPNPKKLLISSPSVDIFGYEIDELLNYADELSKLIEDINAVLDEEKTKSIL